MLLGRGSLWQKGVVEELIFFLVTEKKGKGNRKGHRQDIPRVWPQGPRVHLLQFPEFLKIMPAAWEATVQPREPVGDILYSNDCRGLLKNSNNGLGILTEGGIKFILFSLCIKYLFSFFVKVFHPCPMGMTLRISEGNAHRSLLPQWFSVQLSLIAFIWITDPWQASLSPISGLPVLYQEACQMSWEVVTLLLNSSYWKQTCLFIILCVSGRA